MVFFPLLWGVLTFGAVHSWANVPLLASAGTIGSWMWLRARTAPSLHSPLLVVLALVALPIVLQLGISVDLWGNAALANGHLLRGLSFGGETTSTNWQPLSVAPISTLGALAFVGVGAVWVAGVRRAMQAQGAPRQLAMALLGLAVSLALFAVVQKATFNGKIYWFWESPFGSTTNYYGPFVNRNHFAGWMLLAIAIGAGYFTGLLADPFRRVKPTWRDRVLWLGSPDGSKVLLTGAALAVMAVAQIWSLSRSGIGGTALALLIITVAAMRRFQTRATRMSTAGLVALLFAGAIAWKGFDALAAWYGNTDTLEWRFALWRDSLAPLRDFYLLGSGLNTYGTVMLLYPQTDTTVHAQQAHNDYLQLAIEGGLLVVIPWLIAGAIIAREIVRRLRQPQDEQTWWIRMGAVAGICGMALQETTEFSLQVPGVALLFATLLAIALHEPAPLPSRRHKRRRVPTEFRSDEMTASAAGSAVNA